MPIRVLGVERLSDAEATCFTSPDAFRAPLNWAFSTDDSGTLPFHASLVAEIDIDQPLAYPVGKGSAAILPSMAPNNRRVR